MKRFSMKQVLLTRLRDVNTSASEYRDISDKLGVMLAQEAASHLGEKTVEVTTPLGVAEGKALTYRPVLIPILRAGLAMLTPFLKVYPDAKVGFIGLQRDEKTAIAHMYFKKLPTITRNDRVLLLDPMIATGGSAISAVKSILAEGVPEEHILLVSIIAAPEGIDEIKQAYPAMTVQPLQVDEQLNTKKFIVPGLGDYGDRYFDTL